MVWDDASEMGFPRNDLTPASYAALRAQNQVFDELAAVAEAAFTLTGEGEPEKVEGRRVTASFFPVLGIAPRIGRAFRPDDDRPGADRVTVLSHGLWQRRFGRDPNVVGRDILLDGRTRRSVHRDGIHRRGLGATDDDLGKSEGSAATPSRGGEPV